MSVEPIIERSSLKYNFLKRIIYRFDFSGVTETDIGEIVTQIRTFLETSGFSNYAIKKQNNIDVQLNLDNIQQPSSSLQKIESVNVHCFLNDASGIEIALSSKFICINVNATHYTPFEVYGDLAQMIYAAYKKSVSLLCVSRIGLRKINVCGIRDKVKIKYFFSENLFSLYTGIEGSLNNCSKKVSAFATGMYKINLATSIEEGSLAGAPLYKIVLDSDVYLDDTATIASMIMDANSFKEMNNLLFNIYISAITKDFQEKLKQDVFDNSEIIGVEPND